MNANDAELRTSAGRPWAVCLSGVAVLGLTLPGVEAGEEEKGEEAVDPVERESELEDYRCQRWSFSEMGRSLSVMVSRSVSQ